MAREDGKNPASYDVNTGEYTYTIPGAEGEEPIILTGPFNGILSQIQHKGLTYRIQTGRPAGAAEEENTVQE